MENLTEKQALDLAIELWTEMAERDGPKPEWASDYYLACPLCQYTQEKVNSTFLGAGDCIEYCPLEPKVMCGCEVEKRFAYPDWVKSQSKENAARFRDQLIAIQEEKYPAEMTQPEEIWEDVTGECTLTLERPGYDGTMIPLLKHDGFIVAHLLDFDKTGQMWSPRPNHYKIEQIGCRIKVSKRVN